jgi:hypothetical protein
MRSPNISPTEEFQEARKLTGNEMVDLRDMEMIQHKTINRCSQTSKIMSNLKPTTEIKVFEHVLTNTMYSLPRRTKSQN